MPWGGRASRRDARRTQITTHWSAPPQHAGYRSGQTCHGDGWPEWGGAGPQCGPHIPNLVPREEHRWQGPAQWPGAQPVPRSPFGEERAPQYGHPARRPNAWRPWGRR